MVTKRQIVSSIIVLLFILSIMPLALADRDGGQQKKELRLQERTEQERESSDSDGNTDEGTSDTRSELRERVQEKVNDAKGKRTTLEEHKENAKKRVKELKGKYEELKEKHKQVEQMYESQKEKLKELKEKSTRCKDESTQECKSRKAELKKGVRQHLIKTNNLITASLERLVSRVQNSKVLTEEQKEEALVKLTELEAELTAKQEEVEALAENATNEELRNAVKDLKSTWQSVRKEQKRIISSLISSKIDDIAEKQGSFETSMDAKIAELKALNVDTSELEALLSNFTAKKEELLRAKEAWKAGTGTLEEVKRITQESKEILRNFIAKYNELKESADTGEAEGTNNSGNETGESEEGSEETPGEEIPDNSTEGGEGTGSESGSEGEEPVPENGEETNEGEATEAETGDESAAGENNTSGEENNVQEGTTIEG